MSIFKTFFDLFKTVNNISKNLVTGEFGVYKKNKNWRIRGHFDSYQIDLSKQKPTITPEVYENRYRADNITITLPTGEVWKPIEPKVSVKCIEQGWNESGRTLKGQNPNYSFHSFYVYYNDMDYNALLVHIADINQFLNINQTVIDKWIADVGVYTQNLPFEKTITNKNYRICWKFSGGDCPHTLKSYGTPLYSMTLYFNKI